MQVRPARVGRASDARPGSHGNNLPADRAALASPQDFDVS